MEGPQVAPHPVMTDEGVMNTYNIDSQTFKKIMEDPKELLLI